MKWIEFSLKVPPEYVEPISHVFHQYGDGGVVIENPSEFNTEVSTLPYSPLLSRFGYNDEERYWISKNGRTLIFVKQSRAETILDKTAENYIAKKNRDNKE